MKMVFRQVYRNKSKIGIIYFLYVLRFTFCDCETILSNLGFDNPMLITQLVTAFDDPLID